jgi:hypothetical protein
MNQLYRCFTCDYAMIPDETFRMDDGNVTRYFCRDCVGKMRLKPGVVLLLANMEQMKVEGSHRDS